jgi:hypothetical protein
MKAYYNNTLLSQRHGPRPIPKDWRYFQCHLVFALHYCTFTATDMLLRQERVELKYISESSWKKNLRSRTLRQEILKERYSILLLMTRKGLSLLSL